MVESNRYTSFAKFILQSILDCLKLSLDWSKSDDFEEEKKDSVDRPRLRDFTEKQKLQEVFNNNNTP